MTTPARLSGPLAGPATSWPRWAWEFYLERASIREAAGEGPAEASRNAEQDVLRWHALGGEEALTRPRSGRGA